MEISACSDIFCPKKPRFSVDDFEDALLQEQSGITELSHILADTEHDQLETIASLFESTIAKHRRNVSTIAQNLSDERAAIDNKYCGVFKVDSARRYQLVSSFLDSALAVGAVAGGILTITGTGGAAAGIATVVLGALGQACSKFSDITMRRANETAVRDALLEAQEWHTQVMDQSYTMVGRLFKAQLDLPASSSGSSSRTECDGGEVTFAIEQQSSDSGSRKDKFKETLREIDEEIKQRDFKRNGRKTIKSVESAPDLSKATHSIKWSVIRDEA